MRKRARSLSTRDHVPSVPNCGIAKRRHRRVLLEDRLASDLARRVRPGAEALRHAEPELCEPELRARVRHDRVDVARVDGLLAVRAVAEEPLPDGDDGGEEVSARVLHRVAAAEPGDRGVRVDRGLDVRAVELRLELVVDAGVLVRGAARRVVRVRRVRRARDAARGSGGGGDGGGGGGEGRRAGARVRLDVVDVDVPHLRKGDVLERVAARAVDEDGLAVRAAEGREAKGARRAHGRLVLALEREAHAARARGERADVAHVARGEERVGRRGVDDALLLPEEDGAAVVERRVRPRVADGEAALVEVRLRARRVLREDEGGRRRRLVPSVRPEGERERRGEMARGGGGGGA
jgi:hypothetical protein